MEGDHRGHGSFGNKSLWSLPSKSINMDPLLIPVIWFGLQVLTELQCVPGTFLGPGIQQGTKQKRNPCSSGEDRQLQDEPSNYRVALP